jgi:hypothetical protein
MTYSLQKKDTFLWNLGGGSESEVHLLLQVILFFSQLRL